MIDVIFTKMIKTGNGITEQWDIGDHCAVQVAVLT